MAPETGKEPLRIFFNDGIGRPIVYGAGILAFVLILYGFIREDVVLMLLSLVPMAFSGYHLPALHNDRPQVIVADRGLYLDGLGLIPWEEIEEIDYYDPSLDEDDDERDEDVALLPPEIVVLTSHSLEVVIDPQSDLTLSRTFQIMAWRLEELDLIRLRLGILNVDPDFLITDMRLRLRKARGLWG